MAELRFHRAARAELIEAITYYKAQRPGYGDKLAAEVEKVVERIVELPGSGAPCSGYPPELDVHAYRLRLFPYSLIVASIDGERMVFAMAHERIIQQSLPRLPPEKAASGRPFFVRLHRSAGSAGAPE